MSEQKNGGRTSPKEPARSRQRQTSEAPFGSFNAQASDLSPDQRPYGSQPRSRFPEPKPPEKGSARREPRPRPMLTRRDVAEWWNKSVRSVDRVIRSGELRAYLINGSVRIPEEEVEAFLLRRRVR